MIRAKIEEYRVTKSPAALDEIKKAAESSKPALAFLYTVEPETYKEAVVAAAQDIAALTRDEDGLFVSGTQEQQSLLSEVMPLYTLYETRLNKKENYNDIVNQCRTAVKKYPDSNAVFLMLAEVLEYFSEEIYEHYRTIQRLLWEQYVLVSGQMTEETACALAKACFYKAFLLEKYEEDLKPFASEQYPVAYFAIKRLEYRFERN